MGSKPPECQISGSVTDCILVDAVERLLYRQLGFLVIVWYFCDVGNSDIYRVLGEGSDYILPRVGCVRYSSFHWSNIVLMLLATLAACHASVGTVWPLVVISP